MKVTRPSHDRMGDRAARCPVAYLSLARAGWPGGLTTQSKGLRFAIERVLALELRGDVRIIYDPSGISCKIVAPLTADWEEGSQT